MHQLRLPLTAREQEKVKENAPEKATTALVPPTHLRRTASLAQPLALPISASGLRRLARLKLAA